MYMTYLYRCGNKHEIVKFFRVKDYVEAVACERCDLAAVRIFTAPSVKVAVDVCYDSPIDGRPITSHAARNEDLKRHGCIPYDPEMKKDSHRKQAERQAALDASIDRTVHQEMARMPKKKKAQLIKEVTRMGATVEASRGVV